MKGRDHKHQCARAFRETFSGQRRGFVLETWAWARFSTWAGKKKRWSAKENNKWKFWCDGPLRAKEFSQCACLWWTEAPWVPISVVSLWCWQLAVDHHPACAYTHRRTQTQTIASTPPPYCTGEFLCNVFIFTPPHYSFQTKYSGTIFQTLYFPPCSCIFSQNALFSLLLRIFPSPLSPSSFVRACCQSVGICPCWW